MDNNTNNTENAPATNNAVNTAPVTAEAKPEVTKTVEEMEKQASVADTPSVDEPPINPLVNPEPSTSVETKEEASTETPVEPSKEVTPEPAQETPVEQPTSPAPEATPNVTPESPANPVPEASVEVTPVENPAPSAPEVTPSNPAPVEPTPSVNPAPSTEPAPSPVAEPKPEEKPPVAPAPPVETPAPAPETPNPAPVPPAVPVPPVTPEAPQTPVPPAAPTNNDQTLGTIKQEKKSVVPVIIIFVVIIGCCVALPYLYSIVEPYFSKSTPNPTPTPSNPTNPTEPEEEEPGEEISYDPVAIAAESTISFNDLVFTNFSLTNEQDKYYINYSVTNEGKESYNKKDNLYLELYNEENTFLGRAVVSDADTVLVGSTLNLKSEISESIKNSATKVNVVSKGEDGYPAVTLNENKLTCKKGIETLTYTFVNNKLTGVQDNYNYSIAASEVATYNMMYQQYKQLENTYSRYAMSSFNEATNETESSFSLNLTFNLDSELSANDKDTLAKLNPNIYAKDTIPDVIKFEVEARAFTCE